MQIRAESGKSALPICNYSQILYQFLTFTQNLKRSQDDEVNRFFCEALFRIGYEESVETLLPTVLKVGEIHLKCMALLDKANTEIC